MLFKLLKTYLFRWFLNRSVYLRFFSLFSDSSRFPKTAKIQKKMPKPVTIFFEKFDVPVKMPWEKELLWIYSFGQEWNIFILPFFIYPKVYPFQKRWCLTWAFFSYFGRFGEPWASWKGSGKTTLSKHF